MLSRRILAKQFRRLPALIFTGILFSATSLRGQDMSLQYVCESYCSPTKPGTSVMEIKWPVSQTPMGLSEIKSRLSQQTVEVTTYADGFERGLYARLPMATPKSGFRQAVRAGAHAQPIPGLSKLVVTDVATSKDGNPPQPMRLMSTTAGGPETVVIRVEGLEPGLNYSWRVPDLAGGQTVITYQAATCPFDKKTSPAKKPSRRGKI